VSYESNHAIPLEQPRCRLLRDLTGDRNENDKMHKALLDYLKECHNSSPQAWSKAMALLKQIASSGNMLEQALRDIKPRRLYGPEVDELGLDAWMNTQRPALRKLSHRIREDFFDPGEYKKVKIPKVGKGGTRTIEVPDVETRIVARSVSNVLLPIVDRSYSGWSFWSRPKISVFNALAVLRELLKAGYGYVVTADIVDAFGVLPRKRAFQAVERVIEKSSIMALVELLSDRSRTRGVPQGVSTSPLIMNTYLDQQLDKWWLKNQRKTKLLRYADDLLVACKTKKDAEAAYEALLKRMRDIGMPIKQEPDQPVFHLYGGEQIDWLGVVLRCKNRKLRIDIGETSWLKLEETIENYRYEQEADEGYVSDRRAAFSAYGWVQSKAVAFNLDSLPTLAEKLEKALDTCGFDSDAFDEEKMLEYWLQGRRLWRRAKKLAPHWVKANRGVPAFLFSGIES
jgi:hypothetical protein